MELLGDKQVMKVQPAGMELVLVLKKVCMGLFLFVLHYVVTQTATGWQQKGRRPSRDTWLTGVLILEFLDAQTVRNKYLLSISHWVCDMLWGLQLNKQQTSQYVSYPCACIPSSPFTFWIPQSALPPLPLLHCPLLRLSMASLFIYPVASSPLSPFLITWVQVLIILICSILLTGISDSTCQFFCWLIFLFLSIKHFFHWWGGG